MDDQEYKRLRAQPDVMRRDRVCATASLLGDRNRTGRVGFFYLDLQVADLG
jgi:hypothetical protein